MVKFDALATRLPLTKCGTLGGNFFVRVALH